MQSKVDLRRRAKTQWHADAAGGMNVMIRALCSRDQMG